ncbi:MAG: COG1470 family protein, partial [Planctomycetota bacterium]
MDSIRRIKNSLFIVCALLLAGVAYAQQVQQEAPNRTARTRTDLLNELTLRDALVVLEAAKVKHDRFEREYQDAERLIKEHIISQKDLDDAWLGYSNAQQELEQAKIQLDRTKLGFLANATHITIMEAKKYRDSEGELMLDLVLKNTSNLALAESALAVTENESELASDWQNPEQIRAMLDIENVIVSIISGGSSIAKPYEKIIPVLSYGAEEKLKFELLTDVQEAGVRLKYLGSDHNENVYLEKESLQESLQDIPTVIASQFSQEGQLGTAISYHLDLEMLVTSDRSFSLLLTNLPPQLIYSFVDSRGARITSVRFTELVSKFNLTLQISIPEKLDVGMIDKTINFQAWVITTKQADMLNELRKENVDREIPIERFAGIEAGRVDLALIPKGTGRLEIVINNLFKEVKLQQDVDIKAELSNYGTLTLFNIIPELTLPTGWTAKVSPEVIEKLAPDEKTPVQIHLRQGTDVGVGQYEVVIE